MENLENLIKQSGFTNNYIMQQMGMLPVKYYRRKQTGEFTYSEIKKLLAVLKKSLPDVTFDDLG